jgi:glycosyltransferase involved in cell wall biosynthesis
VRGGPLPQDLAWRSDLVAAGYRVADVLVAPSQAFAAATARVYGAPLPRVVHNGRKPPRRRDVPREPLVLTAGRLWDPGKNVATLDRAAGRLRPSVPVLAVGPLAGPDGVPIRFEHLRPLGSLDAADVAAQMAHCAVFVSTALYEPFGLAVLEAAAAGMALVLSDIPSFRELWDGAAAIDSLLADRAGLEALAAAARRRAAHYSVERMTDTYLDLYRQLVSPAFAHRHDGPPEAQP